MRSNATFYLFSLVIALCFWGCKDEQNPDLLYDFANLEMDEVDSGDPLVLESAILNEAATCSGCNTLTSGDCDRGIRLEYRADNTEPWVDAQLQDQDGNIVFEIVRPVPEIQPGSTYTKTEGFIFTTPGLYRYKLESDRSDEVEERVETNNDATTEDGDVKALSTNNPRKYKLIVRVSDPTGTHLPVVKGKLPNPVEYFDR